MNSKLVYLISALVFIFGTLLGGVSVYLYLTTTPQGIGDGGDVIACTMEAKICPDGSSVGRSGPNCEFAACPIVTTDDTGTTGNIENKVGTTTPPGDDIVGCTMDVKTCPDGSFVGRMAPDCEFQACPTVSVKSGCTVDGDCAAGYECVDLSPVVREGVSANLQCHKIGSPRPICLSGETKIATPSGDILVKNIKEGMAVWTINTNGKKISEKVLLTGKTRVPITHKVMHIKLSDGRELFVSPGHKIADGRTAEQIILGDTLSSGTVIFSTLAPYAEEYTYDILPAGDTGMYFANGILLQSTLK